MRVDYNSRLWLQASGISSNTLLTILKTESPFPGINYPFPEYLRSSAFAVNAYNEGELNVTFETKE